MNCESINIHPFRSGHNLDSNGHKTDLLSGSGYHVINHADLKESAYESLNPCRYDANLGTDDTDGCSQTSSQDSVSDLSQETLPSSPISASSDDQGSDSHCDSSSEGQWSRATDSNYRRGWDGKNSGNDIVNYRIHSYRDNSQHYRELHQSAAHTKDGHAFPGFTNVPFRFKEDQNVRKAQDSTPFPAQTEHRCQSTAVTASGVPLSQSSRRRACPNGMIVSPPKLRRDTENTDAIVKMIVIFCTNLISSIWNTNAAYETSASPSTGSNVLPLQIFITETLRRSKTSYSTLQVALYYLIILKQCLSTSQQERSSNQSGCRAMQCGRRMFLTALILASKYLQDRNYSARAWSKISGLPLKEINDNERNYLAIVGWDLHVPKDTFENWSKIVLSICRLSTEQEASTSGSDNHPPSPGMPPAFSRRCQLQNMCRDVSALRGWWTSNLRGLCTDIVRSCQKTEQYLLSVSPFREGSTLTRPILDQTPRPESPESLSFSDSDSTPKILPRVPNLDRINQTFQSVDCVDSPAATLSMPPPPMLRNLPTPQTTPRSDMTNIWTPQLFKPNLRCRASASALSSLGRTCQSLATLDVCPPPAPRTWTANKFHPWQGNATPTPSQVAERSITSSPESVVSENWSFVGRSRSSSISSTSSFLTASSSTNSASENDGFERLQQDYAAKQRQQPPDPTSKILQQQCPWLTREHIDRPRTAFRVSDMTSNHCSKTVSAHQVRRGGNLSEGSSTSSDSGLKKDESEAAFGLVAIKTLDHINLATTRLSPVRCNTSTTFQSMRPETSKPHLLKRSRSDTLDLTYDSIAALYGSSDPSSSGNSNTCPRTQIWNQDLTKCVTNPCQSYATPRKPVPCGTQNKRLAVQTPSSAATLATGHLRQDITVT